MKIFSLVFILLLSTIKVFGQQFSQYNTGTLYDSFENPSQRAFIPDSSKILSFNFLAPNGGANIFINGDAQATFKSRYFLNTYNNSALQIGQGKVNNVSANVNIYLVMAKLFLSLKGDEEVGVSVQTRGDGKGLITDETVSLLNGIQDFTNGALYSNKFNGNYHFETYNQFSLTYKEKIDDQVTFGTKLSALLGTAYSYLSVINSSGSFDNKAETAYLHLQGQFRSSYLGSQSNSAYFSPNFRNPGAAISIGLTDKTESGLTIQGNVKDLGFIRWGGLSTVYRFNSSGAISGLGGAKSADSIYHLVSSITHHRLTQAAFATPIDGRAELSVSKSYWVYGEEVKYSPTFVASKELFYPGFTGALVNPFQYQDYVVTLTTAYDNLNTFTVGAQFMMKTPNFEAFIGTDKLIQSFGLLGDKLSAPAQFSSNPAFTGGSIFIGFSLKFGYVIEHPMNSAYTPGGPNKNGFLRNLFESIFYGTDMKKNW